MQTLILAAGYGLRLRPLTLLYPKALIPVLNVPLLQLQLDRLTTDARIREVFINRHYQADRFPPPEAWAAPVPVHYLDETDFPYGTGGAVRNLWDATGRTDDVLVLNVDSLGWTDVGRFLDAAEATDADAVLYVRRRPETAPTYTAFHMNETTGELRPPTASPPAETADVFYAGLALLRRSALRRLPTDVPSDWFRDAVAPAWQADEIRLVGYRDDAPWWDLGQADRFLETYGDIVRTWQEAPDGFGPLRTRWAATGTWQRPGLWIHPTAEIADDVSVEEWAVVGAHARVHAAVLRVAVLDQSVQVQRARLQKVFVGPGTVLEGFDIGASVVATDTAGALHMWTW